MIDLNHTITKAKIANGAINAAIDAIIVENGRAEPSRAYLGASALGHDCLRKIQMDWRNPVRPEARTARIFTRGHWWEAYCARLMQDAGFVIVRDNPAIAFSQLDNLFCGHGDGLIFSGPKIEGVGYPCLWEAKGLGAKGWTKLSKDGLPKAYPGYADQVALYQAYFGLEENPAVFTAANMDTMEILHLLVPFDAERAQNASDKAVLIVKADQAGELLPKVAADGDDWRCRMCGHKRSCWE